MVSHCAEGEEKVIGYELDLVPITDTHPDIQVYATEVEVSWALECH